MTEQDKKTKDSPKTKKALIDEIVAEEPMFDSDSLERTNKRNIKAIHNLLGIE